jgi:hypothetical protein
MIQSQVPLHHYYRHKLQGLDRWPVPSSSQSPLFNPFLYWSSNIPFSSRIIIYTLTGTRQPICHIIYFYILKFNLYGLMLRCEFFSDIFRTYFKETYFNAYILILLLLILFTRLNRMYWLRVGIVQSVPSIAAIVWSNERPTLIHPPVLSRCSRHI